MEKNVFKLYYLNLDNGFIFESTKEFDNPLRADEECKSLNSKIVNMENKSIMNFYFYADYTTFSAFRSQEERKELALAKLKEWNDELNKMKALYMVSIKSILQGGLNKEEAV